MAGRFAWARYHLCWIFDILCIFTIFYIFVHMHSVCETFCICNVWNCVHSLQQSTQLGTMISIYSIFILEHCLQYRTLPAARNWCSLLCCMCIICICTICRICRICKITTVCIAALGIVMLRAEYAEYLEYASFIFLVYLHIPYILWWIEQGTSRHSASEEIQHHMGCGVVYIHYIYSLYYSIEWHVPMEEYKGPNIKHLDKCVIYM